jgi:alpha-galactosidase
MKICYIGGGSRNWAWVLMQDLALERDIGSQIELYDLDFDAAKSNETIAMALMAEHNPGRWQFRANPSLEDALTGSDFVFISILPGDFEEMAVDVHGPEQYGIWQPVGDTVGPGGIIRAMRTIPQYQRIARSIKKWAPNAWVINYTNPMTICTRTLYREFPGIKAFGCCHEVFNTQKLLGTVLEQAGLAPADSIRREDITTRVSGINHFTWIDRASWKGIDVFPYYRRFVEQYAEPGFTGAAAATTFSKGGAEKRGDWRTDYFSSAERVKMDLFHRYGLIAAAGDRHLAEFCPHSWYLQNPDQVKEWMFSLTPVSWRIQNREQLRQRAQALREGKEKMIPASSGEEGIKIMKALLGLGNLVTNVNLPNKGQAPDLSRDAVVETNAFFSQDSIQPLAGPGLPADVSGLVARHVYSQEGIIEAVFERDMEKAFRVFAQDLSIETLSVKDARSLFTTMTAKTLKDQWNAE